MSLHIQRTLESFFNQTIKTWPEKGTLVRIHCPKSDVEQYIVISHIENTVITTFHQKEKRVMRIRVKRLYGLEIGIDSGPLLRDRRAFLGKLQFTKIYAFTRDLDPASKCQRTIQEIRRDYFEYIERAEGSLVRVFPIVCIRLVQEYMS